MNVLSLFDYTGVMVEPWAKAGYECWLVDTQHKEGVNRKTKRDHIHTIGCDLKHMAWRPTHIEELLLEIGYSAEIIFAFPPCTDLAVSGAAHFKKKAEINPDYRAEAMDLVYTAKKWGEHLKIPYMIENPVSVISTEWRKPDYIFHPHEYGGYLPKDDRHPLYPELIPPRDAYTKKTCLWAGNGFRMPEKRLVELPEGYKYSPQHTQLGGKSLRTKNIRSATPRGFAQAVFEANQ